MKRSQLAINSVTTRQAKLPEALAAYAAAGFENVEFMLGHVNDWLASGHSVADVRALLAENKLRPIGGFIAHLECFSPSEARQASRQRLVQAATLIDELGGGTLVIGTDGPTDRSANDPLETIADGVGQLAQATAALDVTIAVEFNWSPIVKSLQSAVVVAKKVQSPRVGVLFDPAHYYVTPTKFEHITADAVSWIKHVHLDDMQDKPADQSHCNDDRALPGQGILDLPALIGALEHHGYAGYFSIEMFSQDLWSMPAAAAARLCYNSLLPLCNG